MKREMVIFMFVATTMAAASAQSFQPEWYVTANVGLNTLWSDAYSPFARTDGEKNYWNTIDPVGKVGVGYNLSPVFGLCATAGHGSFTWFDYRKAKRERIKFGATRLAVDAVVNISNLVDEYDYERKIDFVALGGLGIYSREAKTGFASSRLGPLVHLGARGDLHLSARCDLNLGLELNVMDDRFDSYVSELPFDATWELSLGVTYRLGSFLGIISKRW